MRALIFLLVSAFSGSHWGLHSTKRKEKTKKAKGMGSSILGI